MMHMEPENTQVAADSSEKNVLELSEVEARVLACLMEKELTVPDTYPLSLNALTLACNQKSNREPVMKITEGEVGHIAKELKERGLLSIEYGERVHRFEHKIRKIWRLDIRQQALLTVMMLRFPQTLNDLKTRTKRMAEFEDSDDIALCLESLNDRLNEESALLMQHIPKGPGQREDRYTHLFFGEVVLDQTASQTTRSVPEFSPSIDDDKIAQLEASIEALSQRISALEAQ